MTELPAYPAGAIFRGRGDLHPLCQADSSSVPLAYRRNAVDVFNRTVAIEDMEGMPTRHYNLVEHANARRDVANSFDLVRRLARLGATSRTLDPVLDLVAASGF